MGGGGAVCGEWEGSLALCVVGRRGRSLVLVGGGGVLYWWEEEEPCIVWWVEPQTT